MAINVKPLGDRVLVEPQEERETKKGGIIIPDSAKDKPQEAEVIAVGNGKSLDNGTCRPMSVQVGDRVLFGKYTGDEVKLDGEEHVVLREEDILAILSNK